MEHTTMHANSNRSNTSNTSTSLVIDNTYTNHAC